MTSDTPPLDRRSLLTGLAAAPGVAALAGASAAQSAGTQPPPPALLATLCELVLPRTRHGADVSPGATEAKAHDWIAFAIAHGLDGVPPDLLARVEADLDRLNPPSRFADLPLPHKARVLAQLDADSMGFAPRVRSDWPKLKALIVWAYYTSEPGGSVELTYLPIPGRFDGDVADTGQPDISNNWTGLAFG